MFNVDFIQGKSIEKWCFLRGLYIIHNPPPLFLTSILKKIFRVFTKEIVMNCDCSTPYGTELKMYGVIFFLINK